VVHASHPAEGRQFESADESGDKAGVRESDGFAGSGGLLNIGRVPRILRYSRRDRGVVRC